jgi:hypothetical protein
MNLGKKITNLARSGLTEMARIVNQIRNLNLDERDFITKRDPNGIYIGLRKKISDTVEDKTNFITNANTYSNAGGGTWTVDVHGGRIYYENNVGSTTLEATDFNNYNDVVIKTITEDSFICAKFDTNVNPTSYTIEVYPSDIDNLPPVPPYIPISFVETQANSVANVTQLMIGDITWANVASANTSSVALDNVSVNNNSAGAVQIYGFEHAVNTSVACVSTDVIPFKSTDNPGEHIYWATIQDVVNVATETIDCDYINQCVTANSVSVFCTTINSVGGSDCLCDWLTANPTCIPQKRHTDLDFTGSTYGDAGNNVDHSSCYWQRGAYGSGDSSYVQNYGSSIGNSSAVKLIDIDNCYLNSNATATTLNWTNKELLSGAATLNWGNKQLIGDWATTGKHTATEFDVASSETKLSDVSLVLQNGYAPTANQWSASKFEVRSSGDAYIRSAGTTTVYSANVYTQATSSLVTASSGTLTSDSSTTTIISAGTKLTLQAYTDPVLIKTYSSKPIDLVPSGNLTINNVAGVTITNVSSKGILTGTTLQEYQITANVGGVTTTFWVLGRP